MDGWSEGFTPQEVESATEYIRRPKTQACSVAGQDNIDTCAVCGQEIPPGPNCCSPECDTKYAVWLAETTLKNRGSQNSGSRS